MSKWREISFPVDSPRSPLLVIEDHRAAVLADPLRWRILEALGGGKSLAEISGLVGVTDARILYHLSRLIQAEAVMADGDSDDPREQRYLPAAANIRVRESDVPNGGVPEAIPIEIANDFNQGFREAMEGMVGSAARIVSQNRARLSDAQASEFARRLLELVEQYFPPGKRDRAGIKFGFYGILTPIDLHPLSDTLGE